jgi:hypothetical protein
MNFSMERSVGKLCNIVTNINFFRTVQDLVTFDKLFWTRVFLQKFLLRLKFACSETGNVTLTRTAVYSFISFVGVFRI